MIAREELPLSDAISPPESGNLTLTQRMLIGLPVALVGMLAAGGVGGLLQTAGLSVPLSVTIGIPFGVAAAVLLHRSVLADLGPQPPARSSFFRREAIITIDGIVSAFEVHDLEDFGPGYVVVTSDGERVYLASQILPDVDDKNRALGQRIQLRIDADAGEILDFSAGGEPIPIRGSVSLKSLGIDEWSGFQILGDHSSTM